MKKKLVFIGHIQARAGRKNPKGVIPVYRLQLMDTEKNLSYIKKRKKV